MKSKAKRKSEDNHNARPLPVEEYAHLVEGLSEADIEAACAQDGAVPGGVPPAWSTRRPMDKSGERLNAPTVSGAPAPLWFEWERAQPCRPWHSRRRRICHQWGRRAQRGRPGRPRRQPGTVAQKAALRGRGSLALLWKPRAPCRSISMRLENALGRSCQGCPRS